MKTVQELEHEFHPQKANDTYMVNISMRAPEKPDLFACAIQFEGKDFRKAMTGEGHGEVLTKTFEVIQKLYDKFLEGGPSGEGKAEPQR
jgi:hypothetical protein